MRFELIVFLEGRLIETSFHAGIKETRNRLRYLVRQHNKPIVYQIKRVSHRKQGTFRYKHETGILDTELRWHRTSSDSRYTPKKHKRVTSPGSGSPR